MDELLTSEGYPHTVPTTADKKEILENVSPHYTNTVFNEPQTIFGKPSDSSGHKGLEYVYSDRLQQWDYDKELHAVKHADAAVGKQNVHKRTAEWFESYLSFYFDKKIDLQHIMSGVNLSSGYPYLVFGFKEVK